MLCLPNDSLIDTYDVRLRVFLTLLLLTISSYKTSTKKRLGITYSLFFIFFSILVRSSFASL